VKRPRFSFRIRKRKVDFSGHTAGLLPPTLDDGDFEPSSRASLRGQALQLDGETADIERRGRVALVGGVRSWRKSVT